MLLWQPPICHEILIYLKGTSAHTANKKGGTESFSKAVNLFFSVPREAVYHQLFLSLSSTKVLWSCIRMYATQHAISPLYLSGAKSLNTVETATPGTFISQKCSGACKGGWVIVGNKNFWLLCC